MTHSPCMHHIIKQITRYDKASQINIFTITLDIIWTTQPYYEFFDSFLFLISLIIKHT